MALSPYNTTICLFLSIRSRSSTFLKFILYFKAEILTYLFLFVFDWFLKHIFESTDKVFIKIIYFKGL